MSWPPALPASPCLDSPSTDIKDTAKVAESARLAQNFGFGGKLCIHPSQLASVHEAFAPTKADVELVLSVMMLKAAPPR